MLIAVLFATGLMVKAGDVDPLEMTLNPKKLHPRNLTEVQQHYLNLARQQIDDQLKLWVLDATDGIQEFSTGYDWLFHYIKPPYNCRWWMYDHLANVRYKGSQSHDAFTYICDTLKTENVRWGTTGIVVNQRNEAGNREQSGGYTGGSFGSYGGGVFAANVDSLYQPFTHKRAAKDAESGEEHQEDVVTVELIANRWGGSGSATFRINPSSGFVYNHQFVPPELLRERDALPYKRLGRGEWDVEVDGDPWRH